MHEDSVIQLEDWGPGLNVAHEDNGDDEELMKLLKQRALKLHADISGSLMDTRTHGRHESTTGPPREPDQDLTHKPGPLSEDVHEQTITSLSLPVDEDVFYQ